MSNMGFAGVANYAPVTTGTAICEMAVLGVGGSSVAVQGPSLTLNFLTSPIDGPALDPRITFTRASTGTYIDSAGVLQTAAINAPRFEYNPVTLAPLGLLMEAVRTNSLRNNTMVGAVAGSPGTLPTNWAITGGGLGTLNQTIVGTGTLKGVQYIDVQFNGTTSTTSCAVSFEDATQIVATSAQIWASSFWYAVVGGTTTNITSANNRISEYTALGVELVSSVGPSLPTGSSMTRSAFTYTTVNASTARITNSVILNFASGVAIDITIRIGLPQLELGYGATSVIATSTTALTRALDLATMTGTNFSSWVNVNQGTFVFEYDTVLLNGVASVATVWSSNPERLVFGDNNASRRLVVVSGGATQFTSEGQIGSDTYAVSAKVAHAYASANFASVANGGTVYSQTSGTLPVINKMYIGSNQTGANQLCGHIRSIKYFPSRLPNEILQAFTE